MKLNKPNHFGIVVNDAEKAMDEYSKAFGIKKWYKLDRISPLEMVYKGEKRDCDVTLYFGGKGDTKIELLQTKGDSNIYTDFLAENGEGIHHIMYNVKDMEKAISHFENCGYELLLSANFKIKGATIEYAYVGKIGTKVVIELLETTLFGFIKKGDMPFELQIGALTGSHIRVR